MNAVNGTAPQINVDPNLILTQVIGQRDRALTDLAVSQAACQQLAARVRELEGEAGQNHRPHVATGSD